MSKLNLRQKPRISYAEYEEPNLDEYIFCEQCCDYVFEYCAIHGPLLVIPDDKVSSKPKYPPCVPRAALTIPNVFLHLAPSIIPGAGIGVFSTLTLPRGVRFGPYRGRRTLEVNSTYCWQIYDANNKRCHVVDAADAHNSNWMRYVNCARHWQEQNLVAFQYRGQLYYRTIKIIPRFTELMVFYGSEFANTLHVDLKKYNFPAGYAQKYGASVTQKLKADVQEKNSSTEDHISTENQCNDTSNKCTAYIQEKPKSFKKYAKTVLKSKRRRLNYKNNKNDKECNNNIVVENKNLFICDSCAYKSETKDGITQHMKTHITSDKPKMCDRSSLLRKTNIDEKPFACDLCDYKCSQSSNLKKHIGTHTGEKPFSCDMCEFKCSHSTTLKNHIGTHTGEKPFSCDRCEYKCTRRDSLKTHIRTHTGEKPFACDQCAFKCSQSSTLKNHIRTHTSEKPFSCDMCEFKCSHSTTLKNHIRTHTSEKPFSCDMCEFKCSHSTTLKNHIRTHTSEKPFSCDMCEFKCSHSTTLKNHIRTHTGEKPFSCDRCAFKCSQSSNLKKHIRTHTGEKPFACGVCEFKCSNMSSLKYHLKKHM